MSSAPDTTSEQGRYRIKIRRGSGLSSCKLQFFSPCGLTVVLVAEGREKGIEDKIYLNQPL